MVEGQIVGVRWQGSDGGGQMVEVRWWGSDGEESDGGGRLVEIRWQGFRWWGSELARRLGHLLGLYKGLSFLLGTFSDGPPSCTSLTCPSSEGASACVCLSWDFLLCLHEWMRLWAGFSTSDCQP